MLCDDLELLEECMEPVSQYQSRSRSRDRSKVTSHRNEAITSWAVNASEGKDYDSDVDSSSEEENWYDDKVCEAMVCDDMEESDDDIGFGLFDDCLVCCEIS